MSKVSLEIMKAIKDTNIQRPVTAAGIELKQHVVSKLLQVLDEHLQRDPAAMLAEHLQKLIATIESEMPEENLTRSISEAKAALSLYQVTL